MIEDAGLHPVTSLPNLSVENRRILIANGLVLCKDVLANKDKLSGFGISATDTDSIIADANIVCGEGA